MQYISEQKFLIMAPKKLRPLALLAKKLSPTKAIEVLPFSGKKAAEPLIKVIKSAVANAKAKGASGDALIFKEIRISEGPRLKRGRPVSRGRWHPYKKRMSHIRVILTTNSKSQTLKSEETQNIKNQKNKKKESKP